jgi:hypothetical protein
MAKGMGSRLRRLGTRRLLTCLYDWAVRGLGVDMGAPHFRAPIAAITPGGRAAVKSVRVGVGIVLVAAMLGACMASLGLQTDGNYLLERHEEQASCDALYKNLWGRIELIKGIPAKAKAEEAAPPPTASLLFGRWFGGPDKGLKAVEEYERERAHTFALQRLMREKKCVAVDVDLELREVNAEMAKIRRN